VLDVSICIVNWNAACYLRACLRSVVEQQWRSTWEVIVVDNASTDESVAMLRQEFPQADVRLIVNASNRGFAAANNQAFDAAHGRYFLLLNNDTVVLPGAIDQMVAFADAHAQAGMVGCRLLDPDGSLQPSCRSFPGLRIMLFRALYLDKLLPHNRWTGANYLSYWPHDTVRAVDVASGCCLLARRAAVEQIGPLDERFVFYFEETDWCRRAWQAGWKVYFTPAAQVIHYGGRSSSRQPATMSVLYLDSLIKYFRKHHGLLAACVVWLLATLEASLRLGYWTLSSVLRPQKQAHTAHKIAQYGPALHWLLTGQATALR
jgi:GT2 family glycosyltransferase